MAFITNQWLKGEVQKDRPHCPIPVNPRTWSSDQFAWTARKTVVALNFERDNGNYQTVLFTQDDLALVLQTLVEKSDRNTKAKIAVEALSGLTPRVVLSVLAKALSKPKVVASRDGT
jgi:hypothetical protein